MWVGACQPAVESLSEQNSMMRLAKGNSEEQSRRRLPPVENHRFNLVCREPVTHAIHQIGSSISIDPANLNEMQHHDLPYAITIIADPMRRSVDLHQVSVRLVQWGTQIGIYRKYASVA